jgi:hypothetical protein
LYGTLFNRRAFSLSVFEKPVQQRRIRCFPTQDLRRLYRSKFDGIGGVTIHNRCYLIKQDVRPLKKGEVSRGCSVCRILLLICQFFCLCLAKTLPGTDGLISAREEQKRHPSEDHTFHDTAQPVLLDLFSRMNKSLLRSGVKHHPETGFESLSFWIDCLAFIQLDILLSD